ncbi:MULTISPECIES: TIGR03759 family integrating conjugative element protein [unclassified Halomonas]|uniref:TIGR03759 family integrating conjugative element protein n=1 Tax=unclassified Halomonas TaxID=2609666 RepID=UPI002884A8EF|nr:MULTISPECIES: TIGR03759 family integrating conjugative element protein [unclassified Halomonas]MDT0501277.1 TIGR03759 family integrating conjugative element protein [Halomonas sp. PAR7]MDT0512199.1 TIGR03759 family integrating conjugative element protein [Halomonas sp. LES1]MDT0590664.1 TIGR03759 family integrating conjugative element protein [Halomonas sp. PAR8]
MTTMAPAVLPAVTVAVALLASQAAAQSTAQSTMEHRPDASAVIQEAQRLLESERTTTRTQRAEAWRLTERDWERYETLMEGPRGIWSPNLDPITALGVEARSAEERRRYAELLVEVERERTERELAFQRAYDEAWQRLYPDEMPVDEFTLRPRNAFRFTDEGALQARLTVYVAAEACERCDSTVSELLAQGAQMDIFVLDSDGDDAVIRDWARRVGVPAARVRARDITLNHGEPNLEQGITVGSLPQVYPR